MAAAANIVMNDALATPVSHTFVPIGRKGSVVWYEDQIAGISPIGWNRISIELIRPTPGGDSAQSAAKRVSRVKIGIHTPKLEALSNNSAGFTPAPTVAYTPRCNIEFILSDRMSTQDRKDLRKYVDSLMSEAQVIAMVENLVNVW